MNKPAAIKNMENNQNPKCNEKKEKITLEGWLFYFLLFMTIIGMPVISSIWILSASFSNPAP